MAEPLAQAFVRLRPMANTFKAEAEREIEQVDGATAGGKVGKRFGGGVSSGLKSTIGAISGVLLATGIIKFGKDSIKAYSDAQEGQKQLQFAFQKFPALADTNQNALRKLNSELQKKTKFDDDNIASGQAVLAQFGVTGQQLKDTTPLLVDYASKTGKDIPAAAQDVGKALLGNAKALKNIGISYKATGDHQKDFTNITALMRAQVGGFAEHEGQSAAGQSAILKNQFGELEEGVGSHLVPALTSLTRVLTAVVIFVGNNINIIGPLVAVIGTLALGIWAVGAATRAWAAIQLVLNAELFANPIGLIVLAIAALVIGLIVAYKKSETFRAIVNAAFHAVQAVVSAVVGFITAHWQLLFAILTGPVGLAIKWVVTHFGGIVDFFKKLPSRIGAVIGGVNDVLVSPFKLAFNKIASLWNSSVGQLSFTIPSWVPGIGGKGFTMPKLPQLAMGTKDWMGGFARVGERGPEDVFLPKHAQVFPHGQTPAMAGAGGPLVHADTIQILRGDAQEIAHDLWFRLKARGG